MDWDAAAIEEDIERERAFGKNGERRQLVLEQQEGGRKLTRVEIHRRSWCRFQYSVHAIVAKQTKQQEERYGNPRVIDGNA